MFRSSPGSPPGLLLLKLQLFEGAGELVRAAGAAAGAVDAFQAGDHVGALHSTAKGADALGVAVAAAGVADVQDNIVPVQFNVYLARTDCAASGKGGPADLPFPLV